MKEYLLLMLTIPLLLGSAIRADCQTEPSELRFNEDALRGLVAAVPGILKGQDPETGRFGKGIWIVTDQNPMYPLAVAWATEAGENPYYHDPKLLEAIMDAGDALIEDADENGQWEFRKKDGSTWGKIYMPWTYSRWIRAFALMKDGMPPERRRRWEEALTLGYTNIAKSQLHRVHNIPTHHAMGLYIAGRALDRPEWCEQSKAFMAKVVEEQDEGGFWSEHFGPVVNYNFVYTDALGTYYALSGDRQVLRALERAAVFHANLTYPDGAMVETVDERNPYHAGIAVGNVGFTFTSEGRGFLAQQMDLLAQAGKGISADLLASLLLYGEEGLAKPTAASDPDRAFVLAGEKAMVRRKGAWFVCLSAYHCPLYANRWIQDRQNFVSIYHDRLGLILGGGNTKLQPLWSSFTVGDTSLLCHTPGDTAPKFAPRNDEAAGRMLHHLPSAAGLKKTDPPGLGLVYGGERCAIEVEPLDDRSLRIYLRATARTGQPVEAHLTLMPSVGKPVGTERAGTAELGKDAFALAAGEAGGWLAHAGWKLSLPEGAQIDWPVLPHNPYRKDGAATPEEGRIVVTIPFSPESAEHVLMLTVD